jgi:hypothetical protein
MGNRDDPNNMIILSEYYWYTDALFALNTKRTDENAIFTKYYWHIEMCLDNLCLCEGFVEMLLT